MRVNPRPRHRLRALAPALAVLLAPAAPAQDLLDQWKRALGSRLEFEARHPAAASLFRGAPADPAAVAAAAADTSAWRLAAQTLAAAKSGAAIGAPLENWTRSWFASPGWIHEAALVADRAGVPALADSLRLAMRRALLTQGYQRAPELSMTWLWAGLRAAADGRREQALQSLELSASLDPTSPWPSWARLRVVLGRSGPGGMNLGEGLGVLLETLAQLRFYDNLFPFAYNFLHWLRLGFSLFGFLCLAVLLARYYTKLTHAGSERLPGTVALHWRYAAIGMALSSFLVAGLGLGVAAMAAIPWLWPHANRGERRLLKWLLAGLFLAPPALLAERAMLGHLEPGSALRAYHLAYAYGPGAASPGPAVRGGGDDSRIRALAQSLRYKKQGNTVRAAEVLPAADPGSPAAPYLNLHRANLALMAYDFPQAEKILGEVRPLASSWVELWFNASQASLFRNNSARHKQYLDRAAEIDPAFLTRYLKENDALFVEVPPNRKAMDPMPRFSWALQTAARDAQELRFLSQSVPGGILPLPGWAWWLGCGFSFLFVLLRGRHSVATRGKALFECKICGKAMCRICRKGVHCEDCFKTVSGVSEARMRVLLIQRLRSKAEAVSGALFRALNTLIPGAGWLYMGQAGARLFWLLAVALLFAWTWKSRGMLMEYPAFAAGPLRALPWAGLVAVYLASLAASFRRRAPLPSGPAGGEA